MSGPESKLVSKILKKMNSWDGCRAIKRHGSPFASRGEPDIDACYRSISVQLEVKVGKNKATDLQEKRLEDWRRSGAVAVVVRSIDDVEVLKFAMDEYMNQFSDFNLFPEVKEQTPS